MPNPVLKFATIFGSAAGYGWTEIHYKQSASANPQLDVQLNNFITDVGNARVCLLGQSTYIDGFRVSYPFNGARRSNGKRVKMAGEQTEADAAPALSLAVEFQNATFDQSKITHLRGFWDKVESDESYIGQAFADWQLRLDNWIAALKNGYGWLSKDPVLSAKGIVLSYVVGTDQNVTFNLDPATPMIVPTDGKPVLVSFSKFHNSRSVLNRSLLVEVSDALTMKTIQPIACESVSSKGRFNFRGTSFVAYASSDSISLGERRMGRPINRRPGRSKAKPRT